MIKNIINIFNQMIPKKKQVIFNSYPDVAGNSFELWKYIANERPALFDEYRMVWAVNNEKTEDSLNMLYAASNGKKFAVINKKSLKGLLTYCRSQYIITTHNYISGVYTANGQKNFQLWHGMPFKRIGRMLEGPAAEKDFIQGDFTIATSPLFQEIMSESTGIPQDRVFVAGQPVNDALFHGNDAREKLKLSADKTLIVWMPTYRKSVEGAIHEDGAPDSFGVETVLANHFDEFNHLLEDKDIQLVIKPHPMDAVNKMHLKSGAAVKVLHNEELDAGGVALYELLAESDILFTDYSSVYIDYLVLQKPMAFVFSDLEEYGGNRGFSFANPLDYMPGEKISSWKELKAYIENYKEINARWEPELQRIGRLSQTYMDDRASARVCDAIFG